MKSLYRRIAGADVHRMLYVLTVLIELAHLHASPRLLGQK